MPLKIHKTVYVPISVEERLPDKDPNKNTADYYTTDLGTMWLQYQNNLWYFPGMSVAKYPQPLYWLEPQHEKIVLSKEELKIIIENALIDISRSGQIYYRNSVDIYINSLLK